jgi:MATE family multidrug resistance protein
MKLSLTLQQAKRIITLSSPLLVTKLSIPLRGFAVSWIFATIGTQTLAAGTLGYSLLIASVTFFLGVLMSSVGVAVAYAMGANDNTTVTQIVQQGMWLGAFLSVFGMLLFYHATSFFLYFGQDPLIATLAGRFARGLAWVFLPYCIIVCTSKLLTNLNKTRIVMIYSAIALVVTVLMSYVLAFGKCGFPVLGIAGVGWGIAIAYWLQASLVALHVTLNYATKSYQVFTSFAWPDWRSQKKLWQIGLPIGLKHTAEFGLFFIISLILGAVAVHTQLAVYQITLQFFMLSSCLSSAVIIGFSSTRVGCTACACF